MTRIPLSESSAIAVTEQLSVGWAGTQRHRGFLGDSGAGDQHGCGKGDGSAYGWGNIWLDGIGSGCNNPGEGRWERGIEVLR